MIRIGEIQIPASSRLLEQGADHLLPHPATLIFQQSPMTGFRRSGDIMGQIFPLAPRSEDVQNSIKDFSLVCPWSPGPRAVGQEEVQILPLGIRHIGPVGLPSHMRNIV
jgi:hypothetical protein